MLREADDAAAETPRPGVQPARATGDDRGPSVGAPSPVAFLGFGDHDPPSLNERVVIPHVQAARDARLQPSCAPAPPLDSSRPSLASRPCRRLGSSTAAQLCAGAACRLEAVVRRLPSPSPPCTVARRAAVRWIAARLGSCALAPLSTRGLHPPPRAPSPSGQRRGEAAVRCAARELCAAAFGSRPPSIASRLIAARAPA